MHIGDQPKFYYTNLEKARGLTQVQIEMMLGDRLTKISDPLTMPFHWKTEPVAGMDHIPPPSEPEEDPDRTDETVATTSSVKTFISQARIVLASPATSKLVATGVSEQLNAALREFRENNNSNETPDVVILLEKVSASFAALGREVDRPTNESAVAAELAMLRDLVETLTAEIEELKSKPAEKGDLAKARTATYIAFGTAVGATGGAALVAGAGQLLGVEGLDAVNRLGNAIARMLG